jgi:hypothetical protein
MAVIISGKMMTLVPICILTVQVGMMMMMPLTSLREVKAEDKSTSISCDGVGTCEKTECVDGVCETNPTNSSSILDSPSSPLSEATDEDSQSANNTTSQPLSPLDQRLSLREDVMR